MCNNCKEKDCNCITSQVPINCDPCLKNKYCVEKMDADCVFYNLNAPEEPSKLICSGLPSNTSLTIILEKFDQMLCGFIGTFNIVPQDTNSIDTTITKINNVYTIKSDLKVDPDSTLPWSIGPAGLKLDCCDSCANVTKNVNFSFNSFIKETGYYRTLQPNYFTKSDKLQSIVINNLSSLTGDTLGHIKYQINPSSGLRITNSLTGLVNLDINSCAKSTINNTYSIIGEMFSNKGCYAYKQCSLNFNRVPYSERYNLPYRFNAQINNMPIVRTYNTSVTSDLGTLYFNDVVPFDSVTSNGGAVRKINLNTGEVTTLSGSFTGGLYGVTVNDTYGDVVKYDYNSSIVIDTEDMSMNEPALYFSTFGGVVCRMVRERDTECDERKNWKTYIIAGDNTSNISLPAGIGTTSGLSARFIRPYGLKKWYDVNGEPSFLIPEATTGKVYLIYYDNGDKNSALSWKVNYFGLVNVNCDNINIDDIVGGGKVIFHFGGGIIKNITFLVPSPTLADLTNIANYTTTTFVSSLGTIDGPTGTSAIFGPSYISKVQDTSSSTDVYLASQETVGGTAITPEMSPIRMFTTQIGTGTLNTLIPINVNLPGAAGLLSATHGLSQGFFTDLKGNYYDFTVGGIRKWSTTSTLFDNGTTVFSGGFSIASTKTEWTFGALNASMDTQYALNINC